MKTLIISLLLSFPSIAFAASVFDVSCANVSNIDIISTRLHLSQNSDHDQFYIVRFVLKPSAREEFAERVKASRSISIKSNGIDYDREELVITAKGKPLRNDEPEVDAHGDGEAAVTLRQKQDAFDAARQVCPSAPVELIESPSSRP